MSVVAGIDPSLTGTGIATPDWMRTVGGLAKVGDRRLEIIFDAMLELPDELFMQLSATGSAATVEIPSRGAMAAQEVLQGLTHHCDIGHTCLDRSKPEEEGLQTPVSIQAHQRSLPAQMPVTPVCEPGIASSGSS
jgi:hypothetical protein